MAAPTGNIISLPFRRTHHVSLAVAIRQYISSKYDQHPDMFTSDLEQVDELRKQAVSIHEPHASGINIIQSYAAQLVWMGGKFPIDLGANFTWYPAIGYQNSPMTQDNIRFELANVLFNLAVLYCQLGVTSNRSASDGLKTASNYLCLAAGVISHLRVTIIPDMRSTVPEDMDALTLESIEQLMLAQAQECYWQKAVMDGFKDATIAKLAAKVSDLYLGAYEFGTKSNAISSEWIHHMNAKHNHFAGAAQYRAACDCLEKRKYGEEIARLRDGLSCANNALRESRYINATIRADISGLKTKIEEDLRRAEKDNDMIYLNPVPPKSELQILDRASMVSAKTPKQVAEPLTEGLEKPLFVRLVPYAVHLAASVYISRRDQAINAIAEELETLTLNLHSQLQSLNLPGSLQALEKPLGLPPSIGSHAEELRQQNAPQRLVRSVSDVDTLRANARSTFNEGVSLLRTELGEDEAARRKYGTERWKRPASRQAAQRLYDQLTEIEGYFASANTSDDTVRVKLRENESLIKLLSGNAVDDYVPSSRHATITPVMQREVTKLRNALNDATRLESRRRKKVGSLKAKAQADDVNPDLLREAARLERELPMQPLSAVQFENLFDNRLQRYDIDKDAVEAERQEQDNLLVRITNANNDFVAARRGDTSTRSREQALQNLENAYFAYKEIIQNLDVGRKFYNDLAGLVAKFRDDCRNFAYERRNEAAHIESDIANALPMASLSLAPQRTMRHAQSPLQGNPLPAPVPVKPAPVAQMDAAPVKGTTWDPAMGINFGQGSR